VKANPTLEDFTTYTEVDPNNHIAFNATHIDFQDYRNEDTYLYKDMGTGYFINFTNFIDFKRVSYNNNPTVHIDVLANNLDDVYGFQTNHQPSISIKCYITTIYLLETCDTSPYGFASSSYEGIQDTWYYFKMVKSGTSLKLYIYDTVAHRLAGGETGLLATLTLTLHSNWSFRYIYACNVANTETADNYGDCDVDNLDLQEAETPSVTVTITYPQNTTYTTSTIPVQLSASGGTIDKIWYNCKNGTSWIYGSNITYTAPTSMTGFINGSSYKFYAWANNTDGNMDEETVMFSVAISPSPPPSHNSFNLYFPLNTKLAFQHLDIPYVTSGATITLTVTSGTLNGTSGTFAMYPTSGRLTFTSQEAGAITLTSTSNATNFRINGEVASSASIVDGLNYVIEWSFLEPTLLLPIMFILGMFGLGSMFAGPIYGIYKVKHDEYYEGFRTGLVVTVLGIALMIAWLWSGA
jgi:hypothetical protein